MICAQHMGSRSLWAVVRETYRDAGLKPPRNPRSIGSGAEMLMMISFFIFRVWLSDTSTRSRLWMAQHFVTARKDGCERWHDSEKKWFQTERFKFFWGCHMDDMDGTYRHTCSTPSSHVTCLPFIFTQIWTCFFSCEASQAWQFANSFEVCFYTYMAVLIYRTQEGWGILSISRKTFRKPIAWVGLDATLH
jgi:hypothetical protein